MKKRIVITGAGGFLGSHIIETLRREDGFEVVPVTSQVNRYPELHSVATDELSKIDWSGVDVLLQLAFPRNPSDGEQMAKGMAFISSVLHQAVQGGVHSVINISSQSVYSSKRQKPAVEETPVDLDSKYAVGKYASELLTNTLCSAIPHTNLRLASLIGPGFNQRITNKFVDQVLAGQDLHISGGHQRFGFMDVADAASGIAAILKGDPKIWQEVYNFGTNEHYTLSEIAKMVCDIHNSNSKDKCCVFLTAEENVQSSALCCDRFMQDFEWHPRSSLQESLKRIYQRNRATV